MWLAIIAIVDKAFSVLANLVPFWIKRSEKSKKAQDAAQVKMDNAAKKGDFDAYWAARADKYRARK